MHTNLRTRLAALLIAAGALGACATDQPGVTSPAAASPSVHEDAGATVGAVALTRDEALEAEEYASLYVDSKSGGTLELEQAGLSVTVPAGAVAEPTVVWAKAQAGRLVSYEFGPHGTQFLEPLRVRQELRATSWHKLADRSAAAVGYFKDPAQVDHAAGTAQIDEFLPIDAVTKQNRLEFRIHHFSGYLLSTGKTGIKIR